MPATSARVDLPSRPPLARSIRLTTPKPSPDHALLATSASVDLVSLRSVLLVLTKTPPDSPRAKTALLELTAGLQA